jgi:hypothetical protein
MREIVSTVRNRLRARRWQRQSHVDPEEDWERRSTIGTIVFVTFFALLVAVIVIGLLVAR